MHVYVNTYLLDLGQQNRADCCALPLDRQLRGRGTGALGSDLGAVRLGGHGGCGAGLE